MIWLGVGNPGGAQAVIDCAAAIVGAAVFAEVVLSAGAGESAVGTVFLTGSTEMVLVTGSVDVTFLTGSTEGVSFFGSSLAGVTSESPVPVWKLPVVVCALTVVDGPFVVAVFVVVVFADCEGDEVVSGVVEVGSSVAEDDGVELVPVPEDGCAAVEFDSAVPVPVPVPELELEPDPVSELVLELLFEGPSAEPVSAAAIAVPPSMAAPTPRVMAPALNHIRASNARRASVPPRRSTSFPTVTALAPCQQLTPAKVMGAVRD
ncbi:hypothetical protein D8S82_13025 [Mycobacterium hodleri]|uniref:Uncharacterized protein n=1 Tax=Mycolicibacterium hodleri TaxID=49897 RepID=A0A544W1V7_9MYCO|nr:hypothetical protein [Mycolicibacterium hodleri]TQR86231.1 hypothetical protein D8S82_13025 [Mycolicibacterium hodleri]